MPYKHIAAHLQKTELACRLHYHQLSFGAKRRRRTPSVSSAKSVYQSPTIFESTNIQQRSLPTPSPPTTPKKMLADNGRNLSSFIPKTILPKPLFESQPATQQGHSLHLITQDIERYEERSRIDRSRLEKIYDTHRSHFWSVVAREYGDDISPAVLEDVWCRNIQASITSYPPTPPSVSPHVIKASPSTLGSAFSSSVESNNNSTFRPINVTRSVVSTSSVQTRGTFAISSLLTEDKEVRSPI